MTGRIIRALAAAVRRHLPLLAAAGVAAMLWAACLGQARLVSQLYPGLSLRYQAPLTESATAAARRIAAEHPGDAPWPTFWRQDAAERLQSDLFSSASPVLSYSGDGNALWPATFLAGGWPGATDEGGCAVSEGLAHALWGSTDVLGKTFVIGEKTCTVRGVFTGIQPLCLLQYGENAPAQGWQGAEVALAPGGTRQKAEQWLIKSGIPPANATVDSSEVGALTALLCGLPPTLGALVWVARRYALWMGRRPAVAQVVGIVAALALALALPRLLDGLPLWLIPSRWSDFSFWSQLGNDMGGRFTQFLSLVPTLKDIAAQKALLGVLSASLLSLWPFVWLGWHFAAPPQCPPQTLIRPAPDEDADCATTL